MNFEANWKPPWNAKRNPNLPESEKLPGAMATVSRKKHDCFFFLFMRINLQR